MRILIGTLLSFGIFCVLWTVLGSLLSGGRGTVICLGQPDEAVLLARRLRLLRELGLFRGQLLLLIDEEHSVEGACLSGVETLTPEQLVRELQLGEKEFGTAGDGNPSGHRVGGGVSEL